MSAAAGRPTTEADRVPVPHLEYQYYSSSIDPADVVSEPGSPPLFAVRKATAWLWCGDLRVVLEGPLRKRDGTQGRHNRCCVVDLGQPQPDWLIFLMRDARRRLLGRPEGVPQ